MESETDQWDVAVIGGGQAGLATGYYLKKMNKRFIILEAGSGIPGAKDGIASCCLPLQSMTDYPD